MEEGTDARSVVFTVHGKTFASPTPDRQVHLHLGEDDAASALADLSAAERLEKEDGIAIPLDRVDGQALNYLVRRAWFARASKRLADSLTAADSAGAGDVGDLPSAIGRPVNRALAGAGITTLYVTARRNSWICT